MRLSATMYRAIRDAQADDGMVLFGRGQKYRISTLRALVRRGKLIHADSIWNDDLQALEHIGILPSHYTGSTFSHLVEVQS